MLALPPPLIWRGEFPFSTWKTLHDEVLRQNSMSATPAFWVTDPTSWNGALPCTPPVPAP